MQPFANFDKRFRKGKIQHKFDLTQRRARKLLDREKSKENPDDNLLSALKRFLKGE